MFEKILVPVDLTEENARALETVLDLATAGKAEVTLLHVIETLDLPFEELEDFYQKLHDRAAIGLDELAAPLSAAGVEVIQQVCYGKRVPEIVGYAQENGIDLIVMGSRRLNLDEPSAGWASISHQVAILSQTPVLLVK